MSVAVIRVASGPEATMAADAKRQLEAQRNLWPYPWVYPPPDSIRRNPAGTVIAPDAAASSIILAYQVPQGFQFELTHVLFGVYSTNMSAAGAPGDFTYSITRNKPSTGTVLQGVAINDFINFPLPLGSPTQGAFQLARSENFGPTDVIRVTVTNVNGNPGPPNFACAMLAGWERKA